MRGAAAPGHKEDRGSHLEGDILDRALPPRPLYDIEAGPRFVEQGARDHPESQRVALQSEQAGHPARNGYVARPRASTADLYCNAVGGTISWS